MLCILSVVASQSWAQERPNILILFPDDVGWQNVSAYGLGTMGYRTPNIDRIAREGVYGSLRPTFVHRWQGCAHHRAVSHSQRHDHRRPPRCRAGSQAGIAHSGWGVEATRIRHRWVGQLRNRLIFVVRRPRFSTR